MATVYKKLDDTGVHSDEVPFLYTTGNFYQVGYDIGTAFSDRIKRFWEESLFVKDVILPYAASEKGKEYYRSTLDVCRAAYPQYVKEVQGMSDGSGIPFEHLFLLNMEKEISNVLEPAMRDASLGCTDVMVNSPTCKLIAHNEDCYHLIDKYGYIVSVRVVENDQEVESFTSYCYPGNLAGHSSSFNRHGMVFTCDGLYSNFVSEKAPPRIWLSRSIIKAKNIDEAITLAKNTGFGVAYGFAFNIADVKDPTTMWCIEIGPQSGESKTHVHTLHEERDTSKPCHHIHANTIEYLKDIPELDARSMSSSNCRRERARQMDSPASREAVLTILGDTANKEFPIFRTADPTTKGGATIFTSVYNILENRVDFYHGNPVSNGFKPSFHFQIKDDSC